MAENCGKTYEVSYGTENPCELTSTECVVQIDPVAYLGLPANSTQEEINDALVLALQAANNKITQLGQIEQGIVIGGNMFDYKPLPDNNTGNIQAGDIASNGWVSQTEFGKILVYVAGDPTLIASWNIIESI